MTDFFQLLMRWLYESMILYFICDDVMYDEHRLSYAESYLLSQDQSHSTTARISSSHARLDSVDWISFCFRISTSLFIRNIGV